MKHCPECNHDLAETEFMRRRDGTRDRLCRICSRILNLIAQRERRARDLAEAAQAARRELAKSAPPVRAW